MADASESRRRLHPEIRRPILGDPIATEGLGLGSEAVPALRERAATALERALRVVQAHGAPLTRLRAEALLGAEPVSRAVEAIAALQHPDGSFPRLPDSGAELLERALPEAVAGTLGALDALGDLRVPGAPCTERAAEFLRGAQAEDGSWGDSCPPDDSAASLAARLVATGRLAGCQARTPFARPAVLASAADYLERHWSPARAQAGDLGVLAAYAHCFCNVRHELADEVQQWCGRELERGFRGGRVSASDAIRVLILCDVAALPGFGVQPAALVPALLAEQLEDGSFPPGGASASGGAAGSTLHAMLAMIAACANL